MMWSSSSLISSFTTSRAAGVPEIEIRKQILVNYVGEQPPGTCIVLPLPLPSNSKEKEKEKKAYKVPLRFLPFSLIPS